VIDTSATTSPIQKLTERLAAQFPELVIIVAGDSRDQAALSAQVTRGTVYRFLHKPASAQRVKLFVDAAWRRREEGHSPMTANRARAAAAPSEAIFSRNTFVFGALAIAVAIGVAAYVDMRPSNDAAPAKKPVVARNQTITQETQAPAPRPSTAQDPVESDPRIEPLLSRAEQALLANRLDDAERLINQAREIEPTNVRVSFLSAQVRRERERVALNIARASTPINSAKQDLTQQVNQRVSNLLALAEERIRDGSLIEPAQDNARFYIESAAGIAPDNAQVRAAERDLASRLLARGQSTLAAGNSEEGERWLAAAADAGAAPDDITSIRRDIARTRINAKADTMARLSQLFNQRLNQGRLMEPSDSARFYLMQLEQSDASHPSTRLARVSLSGRLLEEARQATGRGDLVAAQSFVSDARKLGANSVNAASVERAIAAARDKTPRLDRSEDGLISAGRLERLRYVPPDYPMEARQKGLSGNVELVFTVRADGRVTDVSVQSAIPARIFDDAAIEAVRKWRYRPYERDGRPVDQRVKLNLRFAME
jgi:TonB family protein